jgi:hypothetical protein
MSALTDAFAKVQADILTLQAAANLMRRSTDNTQLRLDINQLATHVSALGVVISTPPSPPVQPPAPPVILTESLDGTILPYAGLGAPIIDSLLATWFFDSTANPRRNGISQPLP